MVRKRGEWTLPIGELAAVGGAIGCAAVAGGGGQLGLGDGVSDRLVPTLVRGELQNKAVVQVAAADAVECGTDAVECGTDAVECGVGGIPRDQQAAVAGAAVAGAAVAGAAVARAERKHRANGMKEGQCRRAPRKKVA